MTIGNWFVTYLLLLIPIANIILVFVWAFGGNVNPSKKSFFRFQLIVALITTGISIIIGIIAAAAGGAFFYQIANMF